MADFIEAQQTKETFLDFFDKCKHIRPNDTGKGYVAWDNILDISIWRDKLRNRDALEVNFLEAGLDLTIELSEIVTFELSDEKLYIVWGSDCVRKYNMWLSSSCLTLYRSNCERIKKAALAEED